MEMPNLGKHCSMELCQQLDFLPMTCNFCSRVFCKDHSMPMYHGCTKVPNANGGTDGLKYKFSCSIPGCKQKELVEVKCPKCNQGFCLTHRHPCDHSCPSLETQPLTLLELQQKEKIAAVTASLEAKPKKKGGQKNPKLAPKVQLMKLKMKAIALGATVPPESRLHLLVCLPLSSKKGTIVDSVDKLWSVGKAIDAIAAKAQVKNVNLGDGSLRLKLFHRHSGAALPSGSVLSDLLSSESLFDGGTLVLEETKPNVQELDDEHLGNYPTSL